MCHNESQGCVCEVVKVINHIQRNREKRTSVVDGCDKPFLGNLPVENVANTRPFILYTAEGRVWRAFYEHEGCVGRSAIFRVEKIEDCCATLRVLIPDEDGGLEHQFNCSNFTATDSFITINLDCCCAIQCLKDIYIDCL